MARITAGLTTSHIPAIGAAIDLGKTKEPYWEPLFAGYEWTKAWAAKEVPDVVIPSWCPPSRSAVPTSSLRPMRGTGPARCRSSTATPIWPPTWRRR
jgi:hypothetical protein